MIANNGRPNLFQSYTVPELEHFARGQYRTCGTDEVTPGSCWLFAECLRQLEQEKGLAPGEWVDYLTSTLGFAYVHVYRAMNIRNMHDNMEILSDMTMREAIGLRGQSEPGSDGDGQQRPYRSDLLSKADSILLPDRNGDGGSARNHENIVSGCRTMNVNGLRLLSDVAPQPTEWLWDGYIPFGEVTLAEGHPGANKSSVLCDLAARLSQGRDMPWPVSGRRQAPQGGTLILVGEDSVAKTVRRRLLAAGADLSCVGILDDVAIPDDMLTIHKAINKIDARLVVIDTLNDFLRCNVLGNQQVRGALRPLRHLAETANVAVVMLRHLVKSGSGRSLLRGGGSVGITAMARSQLKVCRHPYDPNLRVLIQDKCNLGPLSPSLLFELVTDEANDAFRLEWHGECGLTIEDLDCKGKGSPTLEAAEKFLLEKLADGPQEVNRLVAQAKGVCSKRILDEAKKNLSVKTLREGKGRDHKVSWSL